MNYKEAKILLLKTANKKVEAGMLKKIIDMLAPFAWMFLSSYKLKKAYGLITEYAKKYGSSNVVQEERKNLLNIFLDKQGGDVDSITNKEARQIYSLDYGIVKTARDYPQDESLPVFEELLERGYDRVEFRALGDADYICQTIDGESWDLDNFINETTHDAPIFSHVHVGARSPMLVSDSNGELEDVEVNYMGYF